MKRSWIRIVAVVLVFCLLVDTGAGAMSNELMVTIKRTSSHCSLLIALCSTRKP